MLSGSMVHAITPARTASALETTKFAQQRGVVQELNRPCVHQKAKGRKARAVVHVGEPASLIIGQAEGLGADLIVIGTQGRTGWSRFLMGSVAEKVVRMAECPVLTVRGAADTPAKKPARAVRSDKPGKRR